MLPAELYIEPTNRCNSRCETCVRTFRGVEPSRDLSPEEFRGIVDQVPGLERAVLHGVGEPLLNAGLPAMVAYLKGRPSPPQVLFNSNALALTPAIREALVEARLDELRVSIDAAHRLLYARIRGVDGFDQAVEQVAALASRVRSEGRGPRISLWMTAMRENLSELPELVRLARRMGVGEVYVQRLVFHEHGMARQEQSLFQALRAEEVTYLAHAEALARDLGVALHASGASSPRASLEVLAGDKPWRQCRRPHTLMYITANGNVLPCCFSPFTTRDYAGLILGNAFESSLEEIWQGPAYRDFRAALKSECPPEACDRCGVHWSL